VEAWTLRTRQRWQHPLQPNYNWHRARYYELTLECVWKQGGTDKDRITMDVELKRQARQAGDQNGAASAIPSSARIWRRGHPSRLPYGSLRSALTALRAGVRIPRRKAKGTIQRLLMASFSIYDWQEKRGQVNSFWAPKQIPLVLLDSSSIWTRNRWALRPSLNESPT